MKKLNIFLAICLSLLIAITSKAQQETVELMHILYAMDKGIINVEVEGAGISAVKVDVVKTREEKIKVIIPAGTYFSNMGHAQDMVSIDKVILDLTDKKEITYFIPSACANANKDVPDTKSKFDIILSPKSDDLYSLVKEIEKWDLRQVVKQVAIWIVTDNISREILDSRYISRPFNNPLEVLPAASDNDVIKAIQLVKSVGIDILQKKIVTEKTSLKNALANKDESIQILAKEILVDLLITSLKDKNWGVRFQAARELGKIKDPRAVSPLIKAFLIENENWDVQKAAVGALMSINDAEAFEPMITALKNKDKFIRRGAARVLGALQDRRALAYLTLALEDEWEVAESAAWALGQFKDTSVVIQLIEGLKLMWSEAAADALGEIGDPRAVEPLIDVIKTRTWTDKDHAKLALIKIKSITAINPLIALLDNEDEDVKMFTAETLTGITGQEFGKDKTKWEKWWKKKKSNK